MAAAGPPNGMLAPAGVADRTTHDPNAAANAAAAATDARAAFAQHFPHHAPAQASPPAGYPAQGYGQPPPMSGPPPLGTPSSMPISSQPLNAMAAPGTPAKTLLGAMNPVASNPAAGNYGPNYRVTGQQAAYPGPGQTPQSYPSQPNMGQGQYPQQYTQNPSNPAMPGYQQQGYAQPAPSAAVETQHLGPEVTKKKSSIGRDVAIGVAIAGLVLGGFLAVKFLILDSDSGTGASNGTPTPSSIATIRLSLPKGVAADLYVDDKKIATVSDGQEIPVSAGSRKVKLLGPSNAKCEQKLDLPGGKTTPVECGLKPGPETPSSGSASGSADGSASGSGAGSAKAAAGSGAGSATPVKPDPTKPDPTKPDPTKPDPKVTTTKPDITKPDTSVKPNDKTTTTTTTTKPDDKTTKTTTKPGDKTTKTTTKPGDKTNKPDKSNADKTTGYLTVSSKPSARISIDGVDTGMSTPTGKISLSPGRHKVTFTVGDDKFTFAVNIKAGETLPMSKALQ
jgi:hypothetical protein